MLCIEDCGSQQIPSKQMGLVERLFRKYLRSCIRNQRSEKGIEPVTPSQAGVVSLGEKQHCVLDVYEPFKISCMQGAAWVTCPGRFCDYIIKAGESLLLRGEGRIIISTGSRSSTIRISTE